MIGRREYEAARGQFYLPQHHIGSLPLPCRTSATVHRMLVDSCAIISSALCLAVSLTHIFPSSVLEKGAAVVLQFDNALGCLPCHIVYSVLIAEPVRALNSIVHMPPPVVLMHAARSLCQHVSICRLLDCELTFQVLRYSPLGCYRVTSGRKKFRYTSCIEAASARPNAARRPDPPAPTQGHRIHDPRKLLQKSSPQV